LFMRKPFTLSNAFSRFCSCAKSFSRSSTVAKVLKLRLESEKWDANVDDGAKPLIGIEIGFWKGDLTKMALFGILY